MTEILIFQASLFIFRWHFSPAIWTMAGGRYNEPNIERQNETWRDGVSAQTEHRLDGDAP